MSFLGANDDDDTSNVHLIRAPKAPIAAPKPLVPAGPAVVKKFSIRLSDYRRRPAAPGAGDAHKNETSFERHVCLVVDNKDVPVVVGDARAVDAPQLVFTASALEDGNGTISAQQRGSSSDVPFAATVMSTMPIAETHGNQPTNSQSSSSVFVVEELESPTAAAKLTPVDYIWRTRRMVELETANDDPSAGLSAAWSLAVESMDQRDVKISGEIRHYDDAIESEPSAAAEATPSTATESKREAAELERLRALAALSARAAKVARASDGDVRLLLGTATTSEPREKKIRFEESSAASSSSAVVSLGSIVANHVERERGVGSTAAPAGPFVGRILKSLPDFSSVAAMKDKQKEAEWLKDSKSKVIAALKAVGCRLSDGQVFF